MFTCHNFSTLTLLLFYSTFHETYSCVAAAPPGKRWSAHCLVRAHQGLQTWNHPNWLWRCADHHLSNEKSHVFHSDREETTGKLIWDDFKDVLPYKIRCGCFFNVTFTPKWVHLFRAQTHNNKIDHILFLARVVCTISSWVNLSLILIFLSDIQIIWGHFAISSFRLK